MDNQEFTSIENSVDKNGNPAGGIVVAEGLLVTWQDGPLGRDAERLEPNGTFVETVLRAVIQRLQWYQEVAGERFECDDNYYAIQHIKRALASLSRRTTEREARGVEGTHEA